MMQFTNCFYFFGCACGNIDMQIPESAQEGIAAEEKRGESGPEVS